MQATFRRYVASFDLLDETARRAAGNHVRQTDPEAMVQLAAELRAHSRARRQRAVAMARAMNATADVEAQLIRSLADEDHLVRAAAAGALGQCDTLAARESLRRALGDRARWVVEAAGQSLEMLAESDRTRRMPPSTERVDRPSQQPLAPPLIWSVPVEPPLNSWSAAIG